MKLIDKYEKMTIDERWEEEEIEWERAFKYFREIDEKIMGDVHEKMGLPRNGIRPDYC